jgi:hypothetical protein
MTTPILELDELAASQSQPHVPLNAAIRALEVFGQITALAIDETSPPGSPAEGDVYIPAPGATGAWAGHDYEIAYYSGGWLFLAPRVGWLAYVVAEDAYFKFSSGSPTGWEEFTGSSSAGSQPYDVGIHIPSRPDAGAIVARYIFPRTVTFPASLVGSYGRAATPAAAQADFDLRRNGVSFGTARFASGSPGHIAIFIAASQTIFTAGDELSIVAPASQDSTLSGIALTLIGTR